MAIKNEDKKPPTFSKIEVIAEGWFWQLLRGVALQEE